MGLLGILLVMFGMTMLIKPVIIWHAFESWKSNDATEPSTLYEWSTRFGGVMVTAGGICGIAADWIL